MEDRHVQDELATELERHGRKVVARFRLCSPDQDGVRLVEGGWSQWELVAHITAIEWGLPRLLGTTRTRRAEASDGSSGAAQTLARMQGGIDAYNKREIERRQGRSLETLLEEFARNRDGTVAAVRAAAPTEFQQSIRSAGGVSGTLAEVLRTIGIGHVDQHLAELPPPP